MNILSHDQELEDADDRVPMCYQFLTGATGLLGSYLLRDLQLRGRAVAVLVRPSKYQTAEQRIEAILGYWEQQWQRTLPRPVVLSGDISAPMLGLTRDDRDWVCRNCRSVLHSAASLTFHEKKGEPWRTNVDGARNVLEFCKDVGIRELVHVSSAYVCGLRSGVVYESELDVGQQFGNDYERSKVQAEQLVRADESLETRTIFRPSIIVGASNTGHTLTYHGFYTPLRFVAAMLTQMGVDQVFSVDHLAALGLNGPERKNLVPVDWVSDAILSTLERPHAKNGTYAIVSSKPVTVASLLRVFEEAIRRYDPRGRTPVSPKGPAPVSDVAGPGVHAFHKSKALEKMLWDQFAVYRSYWRDDPVFDDASTRAVIPDKPCPELYQEVLLRLCKFAMESKFMLPNAANQAPGSTHAPSTKPT